MTNGRRQRLKPWRLGASLNDVPDMPLIDGVYGSDTKLMQLTSGGPEYDGTWNWRDQSLVGAVAIRQTNEYKKKDYFTETSQSVDERTRW